MNESEESQTQDKSNIEIAERIINTIVENFGKTNVENTKELIIRTGEAEKIKYPLQINITGANIEAPLEFAHNRSKAGLIDETKCLVEINRYGNSIKFYQDPENRDAAIIEGKMVLNPDLIPFKINENYKWKLNDMLLFLKMRKMFFHDTESHAELIEKLKSFRATAKKSFEQKDDQRGNFKFLIEQEAENTIPESFVLDMPVFKNCDSNIFSVSIFYTVKDVEIDYWFESAELAEIVKKFSDEIIDENIDGFLKLGNYVIIEK